MKQSFHAVIVDKNEEQFSIKLQNITKEQLSIGNVWIEVHYSSINYKDGLASIPDGKVITNYPHIPGIDLSGMVIQSEDPRFQPGDSVIATSYGIGVTHSGGFSEYACIPGEWVIPLPEGLTLKEAMIYGTAGFTAALSIYRLLENGLSPNQGKVLVTGASGGVGSLAVALLAKLGYEVAASTGKEDANEFLTNIGASHVIARLFENQQTSKIKSLDKQLWAGAVDPVGGQSLSIIISQLQYNGSVAVSGLTGGSELPTTVFPFILRGINLLGIDSVYCPLELRFKLWNLMASAWKPNNLELTVADTITLEQLPNYLPRILKGNIKGRTIVAIKS